MPIQRDADRPGLDLGYNPDHWLERCARMADMGLNGDVFRGEELHALLDTAVTQSQGETVSADKYLRLLTDFVNLSIRHAGVAVPLATEHVGETVRLANSHPRQLDIHPLHIVPSLAEIEPDEETEDTESVA